MYRTLLPFDSVFLTFNIVYFGAVTMTTFYFSDMKTNNVFTCFIFHFCFYPFVYSLSLLSVFVLVHLSKCKFEIAILPEVMSKQLCHSELSPLVRASLVTLFESSLFYYCHTCPVYCLYVITFLEQITQENIKRNTPQPHHNENPNNLHFQASIPSHTFNT